MKKIQLTRGEAAIVDDEDFEWLSQWKWRADFPKDSNTMYAVRTARTGLRRTTVLMHRIIVNPGGKEVDHINGNGLDNRKENLRVCTRQENARNIKRINKNGYKGVHKSGNKFTAQIWLDGKCVYLGTYETDTAAALAYDNKAIELFGKFANTNF